MTSDAFWALIDRTRPLPWDGGQHLDRLAEALRALSSAELMEWMEHLSDAIDGTRRHDLADAYAVAKGLSYIGDDGFYDFGKWLILQGLASYSRVLAEPDELASLEIQGVMDCSSLGGLAEDIFLEQTGALPRRQVRPYRIRGESIRDDNALQKRFPRLWAKGMAPPVLEPLESVLEKMRDPSNPFEQAHSALEVWERTQDASLVLSVLTSLLDAPNHHVRSAAARFIGFTGVAACHLADRLRRLVHDEHFLVRRNAVIALGSLGPCASSALADMRAFRDENEDIDRRYAEKAIARIESGMDSERGE